MMAAPIQFVLPPVLNASRPPERRGIRRDHVKLMVSDRFTGNSLHTFFFKLEQFLSPGDVLVLNDSRTIPASLKADWIRKDECLKAGIEVRLARKQSESTWEALVVNGEAMPGDVVEFSPRLKANVVQLRKPFVTLSFNQQGTALLAEIYERGEPVRYEYAEEVWALDYYQTVYGNVPGSVELPSAGRAFTWEMLFRLQKKGVKIAYLTLHTGLSYLFDDGDRVAPEENCEFYTIPEETARIIREAKQREKRVIAVGTTVVRALESAALTGVIQSASGWTCLRIDKDTHLKVVTGLMTGFHEPEASHLDLLTAFCRPESLARMYQEAIEKRYLWHEFGDIHLIL
jgi:S-adenosylmethionine:tRNA ribosyltransferase-isomerase